MHAERGRAASAAHSDRPRPKAYGACECLGGHQGEGARRCRLRGLHFFPHCTAGDTDVWAHSFWHATVHLCVCKPPCVCQIATYQHHYSPMPCRLHWLHWLAKGSCSLRARATAFGAASGGLGTSCAVRACDIGQLQLLLRSCLSTCMRSISSLCGRCVRYET